MKHKNFQIPALLIVVILGLFTVCCKKSGLKSGEVILNEKEAFGKVIELKGEKVFTDSMMDPRVRGILLKDNKLVCQYEADPPFLIIEAPSMKFVGYKGRRGNGPNEFVYPQLVPTTDPDMICYLYELTNQKLYTLDNHNQIRPYPVNFSELFDNKLFNNDLFNIRKDDFMFIKTSNNGRSIFRLTKEGNSFQAKELYNLNLNPDLTSFIPYFGSFALNSEKKRMVYAYKYYKILTFMDFDAQKIKTINFKQVEFDESTMGKADGLDMNVSHYMSICGQPNYVYIGYGGFKPGENKDGIFYIEQYDWSGNPVRKFKLDRFGIFSVDEKNKRLYLLCRQEDDPFYFYSLTD